MGRFKNVDEMEAEVPEVYLRWLNEPCDWLSGRTPGDYFEQFDDAKFLCKWLSDYVKKKVPVPDQLMERITALGEESVPELVAIAGRKGSRQRGAHDRHRPAARDGMRAADGDVHLLAGQRRV